MWAGQASGLPLVHRKDSHAAHGKTQLPHLDDQGGWPGSSNEFCPLSSRTACLLARRGHYQNDWQRRCRWGLQEIFSSMSVDEVRASRAGLVSSCRGRGLLRRSYERRCCWGMLNCSCPARMGGQREPAARRTCAWGLCSKLAGRRLTALCAALHPRS